MMYSAEPVDLAAAEGILAGLWPDTLSVQNDPVGRFKWFYLDNPHGSGVVFLLTCRNGGGSSEIVGSAGAGPRLFSLDGKALRACQLVDFATAKRHRTVFPALLLQRTVRAHCKKDFDLLFGFPNTLSEPIFARLGYHKLGTMARFVKVLRYEPYLRSHLPSPALAAPVGSLLDGASRSVEALRARRASADMALEAVQNVDSRFDDLWEGAHRAFPMLGHRGADFLRWRFLARPGYRYEIFALVRKAGRELRAYGVVQDLERRAHIADLFGRTETDVSLLLDLLIPEMRRRGFQAVSFHFLGPDWMRDVLRRHGFRFRDAAQTVFIDLADGFHTEDGTLTDPRAWYLTDGDRDT